MFDKPPVKKMEYQKFRVRSAIKSFRDLEVYKVTMQLAADIFQFDLPAKIKNHKKILEQTAWLKEQAQLVPKMIAQSYGDKFSDLDGALHKLEQCMQLISDLITKIDFLLVLIDHAESRDALYAFLKKYQTQRVKILNLKKAWIRVFGGQHDGTKYGTTPAP